MDSCEQINSSNGYETNSSSKDMVLDCANGENTKPAFRLVLWPRFRAQSGDSRLQLAEDCLREVMFGIILWRSWNLYEKRDREQARGHLHFYLLFLFFCCFLGCSHLFSGWRRPIWVPHEHMCVFIMEVSQPIHPRTLYFVSPRLVDVTRTHKMLNSTLS